MDFAEAMKQLETDNPELHKVVQSKVTSVSDEAKSYRKKNSTNNEILEAIVSQLGVEDVKKVPEVVTSKSNELNAIIEQRKEDRQLIDKLMKESEENKALLGKTTIVSDLTKKFKLAGFKDPEYHAELYAEKAKKGETGLLIGEKFADDLIKSLGSERPYLLDKEIASTTTTDTTVNQTEATKTSFTEAEINAMSDEDLEKNMDVILSQKEEI